MRALFTLSALVLFGCATQAEPPVPRSFVGYAAYAANADGSIDFDVRSVAAPYFPDPAFGRAVQSELNAECSGRAAIVEIHYHSWVCHSPAPSCWPGPAASGVMRCES